MSKIFKSISYTYFDTHSSNLIVILPQAMQTLKDSEDLINMLKRIGNVLFIESGYLGITKVDSLNQAKKYSLNEFRKNLHELVMQFDFKHLYLVAGSVGAIHAIYYLEAYPNEAELVALAGPAFYKDQGYLNYLYKLMLDLGINFYPDKLFGLFVALYKNNPKTPWVEVAYKSVMETIGAISYFLCLKEILEFTSVNLEELKKILSEKGYVYLGKQDNVFSLLCDEKLCSKSKVLSWVESDHSVLNGARNEIYNLIASQH